MKSCPEYREQIATCAALDEKPGPALANHLAGCPQCRASLDELRGAAAVQFRAAATLPEPRVTPGLDNWFLRTQQRPGSRLGLLRFLATGALAALCLMIGMQVFRKEPRIPVRPQHELEVHSVTVAENSSDISWQAFRQEMNSDVRLANRPISTAPELYRVKDVYLEVN
jgi:hypothetical protein